MSQANSWILRMHSLEHQWLRTVFLTTYIVIHAVENTFTEPFIANVVSLFQASADFLCTTIAQHSTMNTSVRSSLLCASQDSPAGTWTYCPVRGELH